VFKKFYKLEEIKHSLMDYKQAIIVRDDLKLPKGKMAAQVAHASVEAVLRSEKESVKIWRMEGMGKIVLKVDNEKELHRIVQEAKDSGLITATITDAGHTVVEPGTLTCAGIGPASTEKIDYIISKLKLM
jgi:PTH2 family peptidyl-tRNA hydrolase